MWLRAIFGLTIICLVQGKSGESEDVSSLSSTSSGVSSPSVSSSLDSLLKDLGYIEKEADEDLERFRDNRVLYSNRISGNSDPKNDIYPANHIISAFADTLDNVHEATVELISNLIKRLQKCVRSIERRENGEREQRKQMCQELAKKYREKCQEALIRRNSELYEKSTGFLAMHEKDLNEKTAVMISDIKLAVARIHITIGSKFSKKLQEFEDLYKDLLPWKVKLACLEEASTIKRIMSTEVKLFSEEITKDMDICRLRGHTNSLLLECLRKSKEKVDQKLTEIKNAADVNFDPPFLKAEKCAQNHTTNPQKEDKNLATPKNEWMTLLFNNF